MDEEFLAELQRRVYSDAERGDELQDAAFTDYMRSILTDAGELDDGETAMFHTSGAKGMSASGFAISDDGEVIDVLVTDYRPDLSIRNMTKVQLARNFAALDRFVAQTEELTSVIEEAFPSWSMCSLLSEALPRALRVRLTLLTNARVKPPPPPAGTLHQAKVTYHVWDLGRLWRFEWSGPPREAITLLYVGVGS
ncbi:hypothetical protein, partial [Aeromicrobium sp.]|uniref:hypothetical protein n=1 Tax=Aeromicrobium sp. TaxID=1871063 RepID=UPI0019C2E8B6